MGRWPSWLLVVCEAVCAANHAAAEPGLHFWPQWRGPEANGVAPLADPPVRWDEGGTNVRWKRALPGEGNSTPIVWDDLVFVLASAETDRAADQAELERLQAASADQKTVPAGRFVRLVVLALDRQTGATRWERTAAEVLPEEGLHPNNTYASASPATDGRRLYASFGAHGLFCYDLAGTLLWQREFPKLRTRNGWGEGSSPALWRDTLFLNCDREEGSFFLALDAATGQTRWRTPRDEPTSWSTPLVVERPERVQVVTSATRRVRSYDALTGELLWECGGLTTNVISSPVADADTVYCASWYGDSAILAIPLDVRGDLTGSPRLRWTFTEAAPYGPSPLLSAGRLYLTRGKASIAFSLDTASGALRWPLSRLPEATGDIFASPVAAAGRVYFLSVDGTMAVMNAQDTFTVLAVNRLDEQFEASPAAAGRQMFLRGRHTLYCLEKESPDEPGGR